MYTPGARELLSRHCLNPSTPFPSLLPFNTESRWKSVAERMREIAVVEDRRPDDEPPANLIPAFAPGAYQVRTGCWVLWHSKRTLGIASRFVCPEGIPEQRPGVRLFPFVSITLPSSLTCRSRYSWNHFSDRSIFYSFRFSDYKKVFWCILTLIQLYSLYWMYRIWER